MGEPPLYVQFGAGDTAGEGWLNFDASPSLWLQRLPLAGPILRHVTTPFPPDVIHGDIVRGLPVADGSARGVYASHVLEHLALEDAMTALRNTFRMLAPGGVFRLVVPDLRPMAEDYLRADSANGGAGHAFLRDTLLGREVRPRALLPRLRDALGNSQHLWMWDEAGMTDALKQAGFRDIRRCAFGDADDPMFGRVEKMDRFRQGDGFALALEARR